MDKTQKPFSGHQFKKSLGQNFISDKNLLMGIVRDAGVTSEDVVIEVGAGAGTLTEALAKEAKRVISFEVDRSLEGTLSEVMDRNPNLKVIFQDIQKVSLEDIHKIIEEEAGELSTYKLVANLPYYITTPIILKFIEDDRLTSLTIMVQKEVAERIASTPKQGDYGSISAAIGIVGKAYIARIVKKQNFYPMPKVDSAILNITLNKDRNAKEEKELFKLIRSAFKNKRKKLSSNVAEDYNMPKEAVEEALKISGFSPLSRAEELSHEDYKRLNEELKKINLKR